MGILASEMELREKLEIPMLGYADLVLVRRDEAVIVDMKWGGYGRRRDDLARDSDLQLLIYHQLLAERKAYKKIHVAYFILSSAKMLARNKAAFKNSIAVGIGNEEENRKVVWRKMQSTYVQRLDEIAAGNIEEGAGAVLTDLESPVWDTSTEQFLVLSTASKKPTDPYSNYKKITAE